MSKEKNAKTCRKALSSKGIALMMALVLMVGGVIGGTVAWLTATSDTVTNTFTTSDIKVELKETKGSLNSVTGNREFKMIPGYTIEKDPKATVVSGSEECWLFVKLEKSANFDSYLTYKMADGWMPLTKDKDNKDITDLVFYRKVESANIGTAYSVLKGDQVTVKGVVTKAMMETAKTTKPTLTVTAYASQLNKNATEDFSAAEAWANIN